MISRPPYNPAPWERWLGRAAAISSLTMACAWAISHLIALTTPISLADPIAFEATLALGSLMLLSLLRHRRSSRRHPTLHLAPATPWAAAMAAPIGPVAPVSGGTARRGRARTVATDSTSGHPGGEWAEVGVASWPARRTFDLNRRTRRDS
jgi:hypothetical protein